jgi:acetoin utilization deacetylase AcuC-like enzyme
MAANLAGGTHHAFCDRGEGFCVFNDAAVAARAMQAEGRAGRILIIDCDVHQGNGTASILAGDDSIFTFSIHGARNFPFAKETAISTSSCPTAVRRRLPGAALDDGLATAFDLARRIWSSTWPGPTPTTTTGLGALR